LNDAATLTPPEPLPPAPSALRKIFIGNNGLRAGWSLLVFVVLLGAILFCAGSIVHKVRPHLLATSNTNPENPTRVLILESTVFLATLFVAWIMSKIERRPNSVYGLGGKRKLRLFAAGLASGVACLSLLVLVLWKAGLLLFDSRLLFGSEILRYGAIWLFVFLMVGLNEEYLTRGYLQYTLTRGLAGFCQWAFNTRHSAALGFWSSALIFSVLFGLGHKSNSGESPIGLLSAGLVGLVFCLSLWRTGSLWWAVGFHTAWDWAESFLYGVSDSGVVIQHHLLATHPAGKPILSGGTTGPEGSILVIAMLALISLIVLFRLPRMHYVTPNRSQI
jgi:membrane protease YdiL (CAAX protease family)